MIVEAGIFGDWGAWGVAPAGSFLCGFEYTALDVENAMSGNLGVDGLNAWWCDSLDWTK